MIAYILGSFPQASQRFIAREVRGLLARGVPLRVFALRRRDQAALEPPDREWYPCVVFVPLALSPAVLAANLYWLRRHGGRYLDAFGALVRLPHRPNVLAARAVLLFLKAAWIARDIEREGGCRQIHAHFALAQTEVAMAVSSLIDRPFSFTAHARDIYATPSALEEKMRAASLVVTCTSYNVDHLRRLCPDLSLDRVQLVHHGVAFQTAAGGASRNKTHPALILAAGRLVEKKGFDVLIDACAQLRDRGLTFRCRIAGNGPLRDTLERRARKAGLEGIVEFAGWMPADVMSRTMAEASLLAAPSRVAHRGDRDGIPNVILEAMAAGLPVVATNVSGIPEAVDDLKTGTLVPPENALALAAAIEALLRDADRAAAMGRAGQARAFEKFELTASSTRLAQLFGVGQP